MRFKMFIFVVGVFGCNLMWGAADADNIRTMPPNSSGKQVKYRLVGKKVEVWRADGKSWAPSNANWNMIEQIVRRYPAAVKRLSEQGVTVPEGAPVYKITPSRNVYKLSDYGMIEERLRGAQSWKILDVDMDWDQIDGRLIYPGPISYRKSIACITGAGSLFVLKSKFWH
jgi:hypothetical protein